MSTDDGSKGRRIPTKVFVAIVAVAALILLLLYLQGSIGGHKVAPGTAPLPEGTITAAKTVTVEAREVSEVIDWPGTVTSRSVANVAPKVMARVLEVKVDVGAAVQAGDVLATLDDREIRAGAAQARAALAAAQAQATQAGSDQRRVQTLFKKEAATQQDLDAANARAKGTRAQVAQARDALNAAQVLLDETSVTAPFDGIITARLVDPGDMATPGSPLLVIQDPNALRLEAHVAEGCAGGVSMGLVVPVRFDAPRRDVTARIEEIAPMADPRSRTFLVKAALPEDAALRPGMFGTLRAACGTRTAVLIPSAAVTRMGQLETVRVLVDGQPRVRNIRTGKTYGSDVEVLSGLQTGEQVVVGP